MAAGGDPKLCATDTTRVPVASGAEAANDSSIPPTLETALGARTAMPKPEAAALSGPKSKDRAMSRAPPAEAGIGSVVFVPVARAMLCPRMKVALRRLSKQQQARLSELDRQNMRDSSRQ